MTSGPRALLRDCERHQLKRRLWRAYVSYQASRGFPVLSASTLDDMAAELYGAYAEVANAVTVEGIRRDWRRGTDRDRARLVRAYAPHSAYAVHERG